MDHISKYPIDVNTLHKGQVITLDELEALTGFARSHDRFRTAVLTILEYVNDHTPMTASYRKDGLHILTDSVASGYNNNRFEAGLRHSRKRHHKAAEVDIGNLTPAEAQQHVRNIANQGRIIAGITSIRRQIASEAHKRSIPGRLPEQIEGPPNGENGSGEKKE